jgi:hypothetical protein
MKLGGDDLEEILALELSLANGMNISAVAEARERQKLTEQAVSTLRESVSRGIGKCKGQLKKVACTNLKYCERRETAIEVIVLGLLDASLHELTRIPVPTVAIFVYIVKTRMLDPLCGCEAIKPI